MKRTLVYVCAAMLAAQLGCSNKQSNANQPNPNNSNAQAGLPATTPPNPTQSNGIQNAPLPQNTNMPPMPSAADASDMSLQMMASDFHAAMLQGHKAQLEPMLADNYKGTQPDGSVVSKQQLLASLKESQQMFSLNANKPEIKGDTATVTGTYSLNSMDQPKPAGKSYQFTDTYHKQGGKWLVVSSKVVEQKS
ncbi:MAG TPA: nuclear transport factor 2 family protein [Pyrinomonadaceae bacterium]|jgi:hypothetical protein